MLANDETLRQSSAPQAASQGYPNSEIAASPGPLQRKVGPAMFCVRMAWTC